MINLFDHDRTHDGLFAQRIKPAILTLLKNAISTRGIFDDPFPFCLIEREAPGALNPWASNWTGKMFDFLKPLSRTFILDDGYLNGAAYGFEPEYTAELPQAIDLEEYHLDRLTVRIAPKTDGILTWLERTHDEQSAPYCDKVTNKLCIAMRRSRVFRNPTDEAQEFEISTRNWLHNSVCFQGVELVGVTANQAEFLLYDNMPTFLDFLMGELNISQCKVLTGITAKVKGTFRESNFSITDGGQRVFSLENPIFNPAPSNYHYCHLTQNEEQFGGNITVEFDKNTENITLAINYTYTFFDGWRQIITEQNPYGYDLSQEPTNYPYFKHLSYLIPENHTGIDCDLSTYKNNAPSGVPWGLIGANTTYPPLDQKMFESSGATPTNFSPFIMFVSVAGEESKNQYFWQEGGNGKRVDSGNAYFNTSNAPDKIIIRAFQTGQPSNTQELWLSYKGFSMGLFASDPNLFSKGESVIIQADVIDKFSYSNTFIENNSVGTTDNDITINRNRYARKFASKFSIDHGSNLIDEPTIFNNYIENIASVISTDQSQRENRSGMQTVTVPFAVDYTIPVEVEASAPITRTIRNSPIEYPNLVVFDPSQGDPANRITLYFGEPGESELQQILYPDGEDGPPLLDPDPDNGDIMPDSIRIKEIHAALEADKYGVHPDSTEEAPKKRLNNLGRLVESAAYVLGVNFNEDGKNIPYPEPRLFSPEKIEEVNENKLLKNAQFAVAEMNGGLDSSGLYEVRSALMTSGRKSDNVIDLRPHAIKVHNLPQLIDAMADDNSKMLGGGSSAAFQVPSADGWRAAEYEGISQAVADALYMLSVHSKNINELQNQSIKTVYMLQQILKGLGLPTHIEKIEGVSGVTDSEGEFLTGYMPVPEIDPKSPTITSLLGIVLLNLQRVVGASVAVREQNQEGI